MKKFLLLNFIILTFESKILFAENLNYCPGSLVRSLKDLTQLKECDVIEGNLVIAFGDAKSRNDWVKYGSLRVREVTGFVVFYFLDKLESLDLVVPNLRVIRGNTLYENYALIIYGIMDLKTISLNNLSAILQGSVFIRNNPWLNSYTHRVLWNNITHWNNGPDITHMNIIQQVQSPVEMCNDLCSPNGSLVGFCWSRDVCQTVCPKSSSPLSCTKSGQPCPEECIGGCYKDKKNVTKCYACKRYRNSDECIESCFPDYSLDNYRCVSEKDCIGLGRKLLNLQNSTFMCVEECPDSYKPKSSNSSLCSLCSDCKKTCDGSIVDSVEKVHKLSGCEIINGSLEIRVYGKRIMQTLSKHLGNIQEVDGYVYIHHSRELKSLKFLGNLVKINGNEKWQNSYSLVVHDNDDLEELWKTTDTALKIGNEGLVLFYANPKLCPHTITQLVGQKVWKKSVPDDNIRMVLNGNKRACNINKGLEFTIEPLSEKGVLYITVTSGLVPKPNLLGFYVYYKETEKEGLEYYGADWHWKRVFQTVPNWEIKLKLNPSTKYGIFLESKTTDPLNNFQSGIRYAVTKSFNPSPPENVRVTSSSIENTEVSWDPPQFPNGKIDHYIISFQPIEFENYANVNMCNNDERRKFTEYYNSEREKHKQIAEYERKEKESQSQERDSAEASDLSSSKDCFIDETVDRKREHFNMAMKLSEFIYASSSHPYKARRKRRETNLLVQEICKRIDGQFKRSVPKGLGRNLDTVSKGSVIQPLIIEDTLIENLQDPAALSQLHDEINIQLSHPNPIISYNCTVYLYNLTERLLKNNRNIKEVNRRNIETGVDQPTFMSSSNNILMGQIIYGTHYNIVNMTSSLFEFRIMACHKSLNSTKECGEGRIKPPCKLCSQWYKTRMNIVLDKEYYQSDIKIMGTNNNNVSVAWSPTKYLPMNEILYYTLYVQEIGNSSSARKNLHVYCESPSSNQTSFLIPKSGNYSVTVAAFSSVFNDELPRSSPATFFISKNYASNITHGSHNQDSSTEGIFVILISFAVFVLLSAAVFLYFNRKKSLKEKRKKLDIFDAKFSDNPFYSPYPSWKEDLEEKIGKKYLYQMTDLDIEKSKVGQGQFGVVHKGTLKRPNGESIKVAVKKLRTDSDGSSQSYKELINEASLMLKIKCFHLVEMYGVAYTKNDIFLVMEYMEKKSLKNYIKENAPDGNIFGLFTKENLLEIAVQIADGMAYLGYKNILHMDLALRNILMDRYNNVKISDFGMSRIVNGEYYLIRPNKPVPIRWMPPEYFESNKFTTQSDVWSYGVLLWEIMNPGKVPYENKTKNEDITMTILNNFLPGEISPEAPFGSIIIECWNTCPKRRPKFCKIVRELYALLMDDNFKNKFEKKSFYFRKECSQNMDFTDVIETDEQDDTPSTPLTSTPTLTHSHFLRGNSHHKNENIESFRDRSSLRNLHKQLSSLQTSFSKSLTFVNNFKESFTKSQNKINEVTSKQDTFPHIPKETPESQKEKFSPTQLKKLNCIHKNGNGVVQMQ